MRVIGLAALCTLLFASAGSADPLLLRNGRFAVDVHWSAGSQVNALAEPAILTNDSGYFTFFAPTNVEVLVKVLDACGQPSPGFWVFAAGLTNLDVTMDVTDRWSGEHHTFHNPAGTAFAPIQRTDLFATCASPQPCGSGNEADLAATPRADEQAELIALFIDRVIAARQGTYDRVRADLAAIRAGHPALADYSFSPKFDSQTLYLTIDFATLEAITTDHYPFWDCLNSRYGFVFNAAVPAGTDGYIETLRFSKRLFVPEIEDDYRALPGVHRVDAENLGRFDYPFLYLDLCAARGPEDELVYFFLSSAHQEFRSRPGAAPALEPFDESAAAACASANIAGDVN